jgi:thioredoxin reductase (NADPH)
MLDLIIIGAGPAGLAASIYASRFNLKHIVIGETPGGTINWAHQVDNYPGLPGLTGLELGKRFLDHAEKQGGQIINDNVFELSRQGQGFTVNTSKKSYQTKALVIATGTERRKLNIPGEKELVGKGVSYCPTCDAPFYKDKTVVIVGGADAACSGAIHLAHFAKKVYLIYRKSSLRAEPFWVKEIKQNPKIETIYGRNLVKILADDNGRVAAVELDKPYSDSRQIDCQGVFIEIGGTPLTSLAAKIGVKLETDGHIKTNNNMETNVRNVFCVGDINSTFKEFKQVISAAAEGAIAAQGVYQNLNRGK